MIKLVLKIDKKRKDMFEILDIYDENRNKTGRTIKKIVKNFYKDEGNI